MKKAWLIVVCILILGYTQLQAQVSKIADFPDVGEAITNYPDVEWIQGKGITSFDKDKIYIVELWATWCVPCIKAMPHIKALQDKFKKRNVVFIAQNVMEDNKEKVVKFVQGKRELQGLIVGYSGSAGSDFDLKWLKAAGINSIPQTFIIQDNKLMWQTNPYMLNEKVIDLLLERKFSIDAARKLADKTVN